MWTKGLPTIGRANLLLARIASFPVVTVVTEMALGDNILRFDKTSSIPLRLAEQAVLYVASDAIVDPEDFSDAAKDEPESRFVADTGLCA